LQRAVLQADAPRFAVQGAGVGVGAGQGVKAVVAASQPAVIAGLLLVISANACCAPAGSPLL
jgi:hypothetical protein